MSGKSLREMTAEIREVNTRLGWRAERNTFGDFIALLHTEAAEATEAYRDHRLLDATKQPTPIFRDEEIPKIRRDDVYTTRRVLVGHRPAKPEGVGSELADLVIRLLDTCDVEGIDLVEPDLALADVAPLSDAATRAHAMTTFGDWMAWLHRHIVQFDNSRQAPAMLRAIVTVAEVFGLDLVAEYERKITYNRTRPYQHGGRTLADATS